MNLEEWAERAQAAGIDAVAEQSGLKSVYIWRFVREPSKVTARQLEKIKIGVWKAEAMK